MKKYNNFPRGSEWRKWDLHVHTPASIIQNYGGDKQEVWDNFINSLENLPKEVKIIGITDYYFIDGYEKVMEYREKGRLKNFEKIFPILEFRIDTFGSGNENRLQKINLHILFNIDEKKLENEIEKIRKEFIEQIPITKLDKHKTKMLTKRNLEKEAGNLKEGFSNFIPPTDKVFELLRSETWKDNIFLFLGYKEWSNLDKNNQLKLFKEDLYYKVNAFFTSNLETFDKSQKWLNEFGNKKLLHSEDIHDFDRIGSNYKCNTWIKADPTFEGLKQIKYEPDRVKVQEEKPEQKEPYNIIDYVQFVDNNENFTNEKILLNQNLNVIIGGKSTGKSILLREIARTINPNEVKRRLEEANLKDYEVYEEGEVLTKDFIVKWIDGREDKRTDKNKKYRKIIYIPQSYLNRLVDKEEEQSPIDKLIEEILKNDGELKGFFEESNNKINDNNRKISIEIEKLFENIQAYREKKDEIERLGDKEGIKDYIEGIEKEIKVLQEKCGLSENEIKEYNSLKKEFEELKQQMQYFKENKSEFEKIIKSKKFTFSYEFNQIIEKYKELREKANNILGEAESKLNSYINDEIEKLNAEITKVNSKLEDKKVVLSPLLEKVENMNAIKKKDETIQKEKDKLNQIEKKEKELKRYENLIKKSIDNLSHYFIDYFNIKNQFKKTLEKSNTLSDDLDLEIVVSVKNIEFNEGFIEKIFNMRSIPEKYNDFKFDLTDTKKLEEQVKTLVSDIIEGKIKLKSQYDNKKKEIIYELIKDWFIINYQITYDGDTISKMSPGKKSFVLLRLIVQLDKSKCPLLIDQPEDDLDNRSVYNEVVKFIKEKKKDRQIIIVTHNPNLAITTDAECIIVANQDGEKTKNKNYKFEYVQGALEYSFVDDSENSVLYKQGIKEHACEILEGGIEAFEKREQKYS